MGMEIETPFHLFLPFWGWILCIDRSRLQSPYAPSTEVYPGIVHRSAVQLKPRDGS